MAGVQRTVGIILPILLLLFVGASRALARIWLGHQYLSILKHASRPKVLIYGAGNTGRQLAAAIANSHEMQVGFLDDDRLHGHVLNDQPIHNPADLDNVANKLNISNVLLAMPKVQFDLQYLQRRSFLMDMKILYMTFIKVMRRAEVSH